MNANGRWPLELYRRSAHKREKFRQLARFLGSTDGLRCLDLGIDSGAISYMLRSQGGNWKSADPDAETVERARGLLGSTVFRIESTWTPFLDGEFDRVVVVDLLEHLEDDRVFVSALRRVLKADGKLIVNVPHAHDGLVQKIGDALGQTYRSHGHVRPGYSIDDLRDVLAPDFVIERITTYSRAFSEVTDLLVRFATSRLRPGKQAFGDSRRPSRWVLLAYALTYPMVWMISKLDHLLFFQNGHMLLAAAKPRSAMA